MLYLCLIKLVLFAAVCVGRREHHAGSTFSYNLLFVFLFILCNLGLVYFSVLVKYLNSYSLFSGIKFNLYRTLTHLIYIKDH